ncbi:MAG: tRNA (cytidine(34)-2'-O)-methyltransferase [Alphaproteobacteria bacterium]|nr:tRNA (cytidine(34)-2'-O)-methyltransferase [Alphaproteobacteria bacterium]
MRIALYQPDIAANTGTIIRLGACMAVAVDIIEPCGFPYGDSAMRRAGLDYIPRAMVARHASWQAFRNTVQGRIILATTKAQTPYTGFAFRPDDTLLMGQETAGVPEAVHAATDAAVLIPMEPSTRSLNVALAAGMILGEMLRQTRWNTGQGRQTS